MWRAVRTGDNKLVKILIENGHDINQTDSFDWTPLHFAAFTGHKEVAETLLAAGANFEKGADENRYPIHIAAEYGHNEIVRALIAAGAEYNKTCDIRKTAGHYAAQKGHNEVVKTLIDVGANLSTPDEYGITPIYYAVINGHIGVVKTLFYEYRYNANAVNRRGETLMIMAMYNCCFEVVDFLRWPNAHSYLLDICIAVASMELPPYVLMEIFDWLPVANDYLGYYRNKSRMHLVSPHKKIRLIQGVMDSRKAVIARRIQ